LVCTVFIVPVHDVNYSWGVALNVVFIVPVHDVNYSWGVVLNVVFGVPVHDVNYSWGVALNVVFVGAERYTTRRYFPQFSPVLTSMTRFSNLKTAVKKCI